jgi:hypothetical protein
VRTLLALLAAARLAGGEAVWDWLPIAADDDRPCELHLRADVSWSVLEPAGQAVRQDDGQLHVSVIPRETSRVVCTGADGGRRSVRMLAPGQAAGVACDADGRLVLDGEAVVLSVPRREAAADRRWGVLRALRSDDPEPCSVRVPAPEPGAWGTPALTRQLIAAQAIAVTGQAVLVLLPGEDRFAAWKHREYRQTLAWMVMDLAARGATRVVLVQPCAPAADLALIGPLRAQVQDVGTAFRCPVVAVAPLDDHACWETSPGVLGPALNQRGREALQELLRRWLR